MEKGGSNSGKAEKYQKFEQELFERPGCGWSCQQSHGMRLWKRTREGAGRLPRVGVEAESMSKSSGRERGKMKFSLPLTRPDES
jgi:hypothetical protein